MLTDYAAWIFQWSQLITQASTKALNNSGHNIASEKIQRPRHPWNSRTSFRVGILAQTMGPWCGVQIFFRNRSWVWWSDAETTIVRTHKFIGFVILLGIQTITVSFHLSCFVASCKSSNWCWNRYHPWVDFSFLALGGSQFSRGTPDICCFMFCHLHLLEDDQIDSEENPIMNHPRLGFMKLGMLLVGWLLLWPQTGGVPRWFMAQVFDQTYIMTRVPYCIRQVYNPTYNTVSCIIYVVVYMII